MNRCSTIVCMCLCLSAAASSATPTASELLEKYAQTQDRLKSFILKSEDEYTGAQDLRFSPGRSQRSRRAGGYLGEVRSDGKRHYRSEKLWENDGGAYLAATKEAAEADPRYTSYLWDGKRVFQYQRSNETAASDKLFLTSEGHREARGEHIISTNRSRVLLGYFEDTFDRAPYNFRRIDNELKQAARLEVLTATELVGGSQCYAIVAQSAESRFKLWIDPQHSFHIARAEITRGGPGVKFGSREEVRLRTYLKNVRFEKFGDVWMPVEADWGYQWEFINNGSSRADYHHKIVEFTLSPDHKLLRSFETDEIRNGTSVLIIGHKGGPYTWQDGQVLDNEARSVLDCRPEKAGLSLDARHGRNVQKCPLPMELLDKYAETQDKLRSYIIKSESWSEFSLQTLGRRQRIDRICEVRYDGARVTAYVDLNSGFITAWDPLHRWQSDAKSVVDRKGRWSKYEPGEGLPPVVKAVPDLPELELKISPEQTKGKKILLCFCDLTEPTSQQCVLKLDRLSASLAEKGVLVAALHCSKASPNVGDSWVRANNVRLAVGRLADVVPQVLRAWRIDKLPWLILTDAEHTITAEGFGLDRLTEIGEETRNAGS